MAIQLQVKTGRNLSSRVVAGTIVPLASALLLYQDSTLFMSRAGGVTTTTIRTTPSSPIAGDALLVEKKRPRIAILSNYVSKDKDASRHPKIDPNTYPHLLNKLCYAHYWGYDYIFNTSWGFPDEIRPKAQNYTEEHRCYLDWGHWHRVPQLLSLLESGRYDWVLWTDVDYVFQDLGTPLESLLADLEQHNLNNVHVLLPDDGHAGYEDSSPRKHWKLIFSSFAVMIRNSPLGHRLLHHWMDFAKGICPKGNFRGIDCQHYNWVHSDQPGLWYALAKAYEEYKRSDETNSNNNNNATTIVESFDATCNNDTGFLTIRSGFPGFASHMANYLGEQGMVKDANLFRIPQDQPYVWAKFVPHKRSGIGINEGVLKDANYDDTVFAVHQKVNLSQVLLETQEQYCRAQAGCCVGLHDDCRTNNTTSGSAAPDSTFYLGCGGNSQVYHD